MADACLHVLRTNKDSFDALTANTGRFVNVGTGIDHSIRELSDLIATTTGFEGTITWDTTRPDGTPRKLLDVSLIGKLGWRHSIGLDEGLTRTAAWYQEQGLL